MIGVKAAYFKEIEDNDEEKIIKKCDSRPGGYGLDGWKCSSRLNNEPLFYSIGGSADFIVDSAWLNYGDTVGNPSAPVPEPATVLLFGTGLICLAGYRRKKLTKKY